MANRAEYNPKQVRWDCVQGSAVGKYNYTAALHKKALRQAQSCSFFVKCCSRDLGKFKHKTNVAASQPLKIALDLDFTAWPLKGLHLCLEWLCGEILGMDF